jgi:hypothetical protein
MSFPLIGIPLPPDKCLRDSVGDNRTSVACLPGADRTSLLLEPYRTSLLRVPTRRRRRWPDQGVARSASRPPQWMT